MRNRQNKEKSVFPIDLSWEIFCGVCVKASKVHISYTKMMRKTHIRCTFLIQKWWERQWHKMFMIFWPCDWHSHNFLEVKWWENSTFVRKWNSKYIFHYVSYQFLEERNTKSTTTEKSHDFRHFLIIVSSHFRTTIRVLWIDHTQCDHICFGLKLVATIKMFKVKNDDVNDKEN